MGWLDPPKRFIQQIDKKCSCGATLRVRTDNLSVVISSLNDFHDEHARCSAPPRKPTYTGPYPSDILRGEPTDGDPA